MLGVDSEFCNVEALVTGLVDNWPQYLLKHRRLFTVGLCFFMFLCGVPMCTEVACRLLLDDFLENFNSFYQKDNDVQNMVLVITKFLVLGRCVSF